MQRKKTKYHSKRTFRRPRKSDQTPRYPATTATKLCPLSHCPAMPPPGKSARSIASATTPVVSVKSRHRDQWCRPLGGRGGGGGGRQSRFARLDHRIIDHACLRWYGALFSALNVARNVVFSPIQSTATLAQAAICP